VAQARGAPNHPDRGWLHRVAQEAVAMAEKRMIDIHALGESGKRGNCGTAAYKVEWFHRVCLTTNDSLLWTTAGVGPATIYRAHAGEALGAVCALDPMP